MKHVKKSVLLWYSAHEIYELVVAIEAYPQFLPWCERAEILSRNDAGPTARLHLVYAGLHHAFTTRNVEVADNSVVLTLVDGPFSLLDGTWHFVPLPLPPRFDGAPQSACKVEFDLRYAFSSGLLESAISPVFDRVANTFVDSFVRRAEQVYGPR
jgi:ribosome-associated toxin RatA of RatAB toxin-antitoxin module